MHKRFAQILCALLVAFAMPVQAADINREEVDFTPPAEIRWVKKPERYE